MSLGPEYDSAVVRKNRKGVPVYSYDKLVEIIMNQLNIDQSLAREWVDFNFLGYKDDSWALTYSIK